MLQHFIEKRREKQKKVKAATMKKDSYVKKQCIPLLFPLPITPPKPMAVLALLPDEAVAGLEAG